MMSERNGDGLLDRPLSARSVIASLLLGMHPPRLSAARLVRWCGVFGIAEGTARVALSRMADRGELTAHEGAYELAGGVRNRQRVQDWSLTPRLTEWDGSWRMAMVTRAGRDASDRSALREAMRRLRYAQPRDGIWTRPDNLPRASGLPSWWETADAQCDWWRGRPEGRARNLANRCFAPDGWAERAHQLSRALNAATRSLARPRDAELAHAFEVGAAVLTHVRADPLLPDALLPRSWPGEQLRGAYADYRDAFGAAVRQWFRTAS
jgi:phenylacetic acid degradation operon negative regulatory protein